MAEDARNDESVKALHRMIVYVRDEAVRLRIMDVAILLEHAGEAVVAFAPAALAEQGVRRSLPNATTLPH